MSSSSSECSEKERVSSNSTGSVAKGKTTGSLLTAEKVKVEKDTGKVHVNVLCSSQKVKKDDDSYSVDKKTTSPRNSTSSCDGKTVRDRKSSSSTDGTSNSPVQSDTDVKVTLNTAQVSCSSDKNKKSPELENVDIRTTVESSSTNQELKEKKEPPKPLSWADLFKGNSKSPPSIVIKTSSPVSRTDTPLVSGLKKTEEPSVQTVVGVEDDKYAKKFAGDNTHMLHDQMSILNSTVQHLLKFSDK